MVVALLANGGYADRRFRVTNIGMLRHRIPIGDIRQHDTSVHCPCNPRLIEGDREDLCLHSAFDNREIVIAAELAMGMRCEDCGHYMDREGNRTGLPPPYEE